MKKSKNRAYNRYEPDNRKTDSKRYRTDRRKRAQTSVRLIQQDDGSFWGRTT